MAEVGRSEAKNIGSDLLLDHWALSPSGYPKAPGTMVCCSRTHPKAQDIVVHCSWTTPRPRHCGLLLSDHPKAQGTVVCCSWATPRPQALWSVALWPLDC